MRPSRRYLLLAPAALLRAQTPPLLLIAAEGHGYHLGTLGTPGLRTPRLDLLADEGTLYTNACASSQLADQHPTAALNAVQPKETYTAALELFRAKPRVAVITLDRAAAFGNARALAPPAEMNVPPSMPDLPAVRQEWARYLQYIQCLDALTGAVLDALERAGLDEETLVYYTSTSGPATRRPLHHLAQHIPLIARGPTVATHTRQTELVSLADLPHPTRRAIAANQNAEGQTVFDGRFRYVRNRKPGQLAPIPAAWADAKDDFPQHWRWLTTPLAAGELYDHAADPDELHNVAADPAYRQHAARLAKLLP